MRLTREPIRAVLLDLDDTLIGFDAVADESWWQVCTEYQRGGCPISLDALIAAIKERSGWYWGDPDRHQSGRMNLPEARRTIVADVFQSLGLAERDAIPLADRYSQVRLDNMFVLDGARAALESLQAGGYVMALVTNGDSTGQRDKIRRFGLSDYFRAILVEGELGYGKPDPRVYEGALATLGVERFQACMVGDNLTWDVAAPQLSGIRAIWIDRKGDGLPSDSKVTPWSIVRGVSEVPDFLERERERVTSVGW